MCVPGAGRPACRDSGPAPCWLPALTRRTPLLPHVPSCIAPGAALGSYRRCQPETRTESGPRAVVTAGRCSPHVCPRPRPSPLLPPGCSPRGTSLAPRHPPGWGTRCASQHALDGQRCSRPLLGRGCRRACQSASREWGLAGKPNPSQGAGQRPRM